MGIFGHHTKRSSDEAVKAILVNNGSSIIPEYNQIDIGNDDMTVQPAKSTAQQRSTTGSLETAMGAKKGSTISGGSYHGKTAEEARQDSIIEAAKAQQKAEEADQKNTIAIWDLSKQMVAKRLEESMNKEIDETSQNSGVDDELREKIKSIIRGYKYTEITESPSLMSSVKQTQQLLTGFFKQKGGLAAQMQSASTVMTSLGKTATIAAMKSEIFLAKAEAFNKLSEAEQINKLIKGMSDGLKTSKTFDGFCSKIDNALKGNKLLGKFGNKIHSKKYLLPIMTKFEKKIGLKLENKLKPYISKHIETVRKIATAVKNIQQQIKLAEENFKKMVKSYEDQAKKVAAEFTQKLAADISKKVKINFNLGGLKI